MIDYLQSLIDGNNIPILTAFILGIITSISPCTFTTNVMVLGFIAKDIDDKNRVFYNGLLYTLGRIISYTVLALICIPILKQGASTFVVQKIVSQFGGYIIAPILIVFGLLLLFGDRLTKLRFGFKAGEKSKTLRGGLGAFVLGLLFALAFCPISAIFYFGMLLPMSIFGSGGYFYPAIFAFASGILVIVLAGVVAYSMSGLAKFYKKVNQMQKYLNIAVAIMFLTFGVYYFILYYL